MVGSQVLGALGYVSLTRAGLARAKGGFDRWVPTVSARHFTSYSARIWIGSLTGILLSRLDQLLMTWTTSAAELGYYTAAVNVGDAAIIVSSTVASLLLTSDARSRDNHLLAKTSRLASAFTLALAVVSGCTAVWWVPRLFGHAFGAAVPAVLWLLSASVLGVAGSIAGACLSARGRPGLRSASLLIALIVNGALVVGLTPTYGAAGAAVATVGGTLVAAGLNLVCTQRIHQIPVLSMVLPRPVETLAAAWQEFSLVLRKIKAPFISVRRIPS